MYVGVSNIPADYAIDSVHLEWAAEIARHIASAVS